MSNDTLISFKQVSNAVNGLLEELEQNHPHLLENSKDKCLLDMQEKMFLVTQAFAKANNRTLVKNGVKSSLLISDNNDNPLKLNEKFVIVSKDDKLTGFFFTGGDIYDPSKFKHQYGFTNGKLDYLSDTPKDTILTKDDFINIGTYLHLFAMYMLAVSQRYVQFPVTEDYLELLSDEISNNKYIFKQELEDYCNNSLINIPNETKAGILAYINWIAATLHDYVLDREDIEYIRDNDKPMVKYVLNKTTITHERKYLDGHIRDFSYSIEDRDAEIRINNKEIYIKIHKKVYQIRNIFSIREFIFKISDTMMEMLDRIATGFYRDI